MLHDSALYKLAIDVDTDSCNSRSSRMFKIELYSSVNAY